MKKLYFWILVSAGIALFAADLAFTVFSVVKLSVFSGGKAVDAGGYSTASIIFISVNAAALLSAAGYFLFRAIKARRE